jgi:long-chain acyl-CoA synthetase
MLEKITLLHHVLERSAQRFPEKIALIHEDVRATYTEINEASNQLARFFVDRGVKKGDRIVFIMENCLEYVVTYFAILKAGAIAVPISTDVKPDGLRPLLDELDSTAILCTSRFEKILYGVGLSNYPFKAIVIKNSKMDSNERLEYIRWDAALRDRDTSNISLDIDASDVCSIIYTSGSMGEPKGVVLLHKNIVANVRSICGCLRLTDTDIQMCVLPFFYVMGKSLLNTHFAVGGSIVVNNKFAYPATVVNQMIEEETTGFSGVPSTFAYLLHRSPLAKRIGELQSLRYVTQAGGHMSKQIKEELRRVLPDHTEIVIMYGATEGSARLTCLEPDRFHDKIESIGKAIPGVTLRVLDSKGEEVHADEVGEIVASGDNIMQGYWKDPEATSRVLDHNGYHTGDMGYRDEEGFFFLTGRKDFQLKVGGHRINTQEIEDIIMETGLVVEAAVIGIPDEMLGHRLAALVVPLNREISGDQVLKAIAERLPKYKVPGEIDVVRSLPKNASGKVMKDRCIEQARRSVRIIRGE